MQKIKFEPGLLQYLLKLPITNRSNLDEKIGWIFWSVWSSIFFIVASGETVFDIFNHIHMQVKWSVLPFVMLIVLPNIWWVLTFFFIYVWTILFMVCSLSDLLIHIKLGLQVVVPSVCDPKFIQTWKNILLSLFFILCILLFPIKWGGSKALFHQ